MRNSQNNLYRDSKGNMFHLGILNGKTLERHEYQPRAIDHKRVKELKENISIRGLMTPLIVSERKIDTSIKYLILDGQHRYEALKLLELLDEIQAKVYVNLTPEVEMDICREANELRKRPNAGERYRTYNRIYNYYEDFFKNKNKPYSEADLLIAQKIVAPQKQREVLIGKIVERLRDEDEIKNFISDAQVPKKLIIKDKKTTLITAQNLATFLTHLCRTKPITKSEMDDKNYRNLREEEYKNIKHIVEFMIKEIIHPYLKTDIDTAMDFCKHHPISAIGKIVAEVLLRTTAGGRPNAAAYNDNIDWKRTEEYFEKLKDIDWKDPTLSKERNLDILYNELYRRVF